VAADSVGVAPDEVLLVAAQREVGQGVAAVAAHDLAGAGQIADGQPPAHGRTEQQPAGDNGQPEAHNAEHGAEDRTGPLGDGRAGHSHQPGGRRRHGPSERRAVTAQVTEFEPGDPERHGGTAGHRHQPGPGGGRIAGSPEAAAVGQQVPTQPERDRRLLHVEALGQVADRGEGEQGDGDAPGPPLAAGHSPGEQVPQPELA
jgi:hypothetical protein